MTESAIVLPRAVDPAQVLRNPGIYIAPSGSPAFGQLLGLAWSGQVAFRGHRQLPDGQLAVAIESLGGRAAAYRPNADDDAFLRMTQMTVDDLVFANTLNMYADWREAWWREAIQNAVDAGSTTIRLGVRCLDRDRQQVDLYGYMDSRRTAEQAERIHFVEVSCEDDGCGMDQDVLVDKFLAIGASGKGSERSTAVGGFGEAKKLLVGLWSEWYLRTGQGDDRPSYECVAGHGLRFTPRRGRPLRGTILKALMRNGEHTDERHALQFLRKCSIPGITITINGEPAPEGPTTAGREPLHEWQESDDSLRRRLEALALPLCGDGATEDDAEDYVRDLLRAAAGGSRGDRELRAGDVRREIASGALWLVCYVRYGSASANGLTTVGLAQLRGTEIAVEEGVTDEWVHEMTVHIGRVRYSPEHVTMSNETVVESLLRSGAVDKVAAATATALSPYDAAAAELNTRRTSMRIFYDPIPPSDSERGRAMIRVSGLAPDGVTARSLYMFNRFLAEVDGAAIVEIAGDSKLMLQANREGFINHTLGYALQDQLHMFTAFVTRDKRQALQRRREPVEYPLAQASSAGLAATIAAGIGAFETSRKPDRRAFDELAVACGPAMDALVSSALSGHGAPPDVPSMGCVRATIESVWGGGPGRLAGAIRSAVNVPRRFIVLRGPDGEDVPEYLQPGYMRQEALQLFRFWNACLRFVIANVGEFEPFSTGWTIHPEAGGANLRNGDGLHLVLNPFRGSDMGGPLLSLDRDEDVALIYAIAMHEVTHNDYQNHYDEWGGHFTNVVVPRALWGKESFIERIRRDIARSSRPARGARRMAPARTPASRPRFAPFPTAAELRAFMATHVTNPEAPEALVRLRQLWDLPPDPRARELSCEAFDLLRSVAAAVGRYSFNNVGPGIMAVDNELACGLNDPVLSLVVFRDHTISIMEVPASECVFAWSKFTNDARQALLQEGHPCGGALDAFAREYFMTRLGIAAVAFASLRLEDDAAHVERVSQALVRAARELAGAFAGRASDVRVSNPLQTDRDRFGVAFWIPLADGSALTQRPDRYGGCTIQLQGAEDARGGPEAFARDPRFAGDLNWYPPFTFDCAACKILV